VGKIPNYSQQDATFLDLFIFKDALHVSGGYSAHHQEHITVHTAPNIVNQILLLTATVEEMEHFSRELQRQIKRKLIYKQSSPTEIYRPK
jgi:hypothetical protein